MKRNVIPFIILACSLVCFVGSYYYWAKAYELDNRAEDKAASDNVKNVQSVDFFEEYTLTGEIATAGGSSGKLKACFYVPQKYCTYYQLGDEVMVNYNGTEYPAAISYVDTKMTEAYGTDYETTETEEGMSKQLYVEATLKGNEKIYVNSDIVINEKLCIKSNVKAVMKSAIFYDGDQPYVKVLTQNGDTKLVYVEFGNSDSDMVEIISDEIQVGDQVMTD